MSMTTYTRYLRLSISSAMTTEAKQNLIKIDSAMAFFLRNSAGTQVFTADNGMIFKPYGDTSGGQVDFGSEQAPIAGFRVYGPATLQQLTLQPVGSSNAFTLLPGAMASPVTLKTPTSQGAGGQILSLSPTDPQQLVFTDAAQAELPSLPDGSVWVGDGSGNAIATDTTAAGDVLASTTEGLLLKDASVMAQKCVGLTNQIGTAKDTDTLVVALGKLQSQVSGFAPLVPMDPNVLVWTDTNGYIVKYNDVTPSELAMLSGIGTNTVAEQLGVLSDAIAAAGGNKSVSFATSNWSGPSLNAYTLSIPHAQHGLGTNASILSVQEGTSNFTSVGVDSITQTTNGDITLSVPSSPDCRFNGRVTIAKLT